VIASAYRALTPKQAQIAALVAEGWTSREIAAAIGWANARTVQKQLDQIADRLPGGGTPREVIARWWHQSQLNAGERV
jgi:DNA-binding NarL/FixJ family response regulator